MQHQVSTIHDGAEIIVKFSSTPKAELYIKGQLRESLATDSAQEVTLNLGSPLQTGYEYHEFITAAVSFKLSEVNVLIKVSGETLLNETVQLK